MALDATEAHRGIRPVVLVVDDDAGLRDSFRLILEDDYEVLEAADGAGALQTFRTTQVDLVLLDIRLPDTDGIAVLGEMKILDEHVEVILVTAVQTVRTAVAAMKLGAYDYIQKPFDGDEIKHLVDRTLEHTRGSSAKPGRVHPRPSSRTCRVR